MSNHDTESNESELDRMLASAESSPTAQMLRAVSQQMRPHPEFVTKLESSLRGAARPQSKSPRARMHLPRLTWSFKSFAVLSGVMTLLVIGALVWLNHAAPVSAQQVLDRAAAPRLSPNQTMHLVYEMEQKNGKPTTGTGEVWVQADETGAIVRTAITFTEMNADGTLTKLGTQRIVISGESVQQYSYSPRDNTSTIVTGTIDQVLGDQPNYFDGASVARYVSKIAQGNVKGVSLLPPQTFNGAPVQTVNVNVKGDGGANYYFDAQSYILRGVEEPGNRVWLVQEEPVPAKDVPQDAFAFNPPVNARILIAPKKTQDGADVQRQALLDACHLQPAALDAGQASGKSPLAICQSSVPDMTPAKLVAALLVPIKAQWDADVAAGRLSATEESDYLKNAQTKLGFWVTNPLGE